MEPIVELRPRSRGCRHARRGRSIWIWIIVAAGVVMIMGLAAWVGVRASLARSELERVVPLAVTMQQQVTSGEGASARLTGMELSERAGSAASLTSDPVWLMFEHIPALGVNLSVVRQVAAVVENLAEDAVTPLSDVAGAITTEDFKPIDGAIDLQPLIDAQPAVSAAAVALHSAKAQVFSIDSTGAFEEVSMAVDRLREALVEADTAMSAVDNAVTLVPLILGANGPRDYLVLFQNPAELRATGGIAGAVARLHTDSGQIQLAQQLSSAGVDEYATPVLPLPVETRGLYGDITARFIQNVNLTPNFVLSGEIASEMWRLQFGQSLNGVLSIDPVALGYLLKATGPVTLPTGDLLTSENATQLLLTDAYARYPDPVDQDAFFAAAASAVFTAVAGGGANPVALIGALAQAGAEHRVLVWSADPAEQAVLAETTLAGGLPVSDAGVQRFGMYLNDAAGSKMGPYLDVQPAVGQSACRNDGRPVYVIDVTLKSTAPIDAATSLPGYVTAAGGYGVAPGNIKTILSVYAPPGMENLGITQNEGSVPYQPASDSSYSVSSLAVELAPGESKTLRFSWLGANPFKGALELQMTPVIHGNETIKLDTAC